MLDHFFLPVHFSLPQLISDCVLLEAYGQWFLPIDTGYWGGHPTVLVQFYSVGSTYKVHSTHSWLHKKEWESAFIETNLDMEWVTLMPDRTSLQAKVNIAWSLRMKNHSVSHFHFNLHCWHMHWDKALSNLWHKLAFALFWTWCIGSHARLGFVKQCFGWRQMQLPTFEKWSKKNWSIYLWCNKIDTYHTYYTHIFMY